VGASPWEFKSPPRHQDPVAGTGKRRYNLGKGGSSSVVERFLAKEEVAGSNPVFRSTETCTGRCSQEVKAGVCKTPMRRFESARRLFLTCRSVRFTIKAVPRWRNGRRGGLKIRFLQRECGFESLPRHRHG
jgi:hypothetical protein